MGSSSEEFAATQKFSLLYAESSGGVRRRRKADPLLGSDCSCVGGFVRARLTLPPPHPTRSGGSWFASVRAASCVSETAACVGLFLTLFARAPVRVSFCCCCFVTGGGEKKELKANEKAAQRSARRLLA